MSLPQPPTPADNNTPAKSSPDASTSGAGLTRRERLELDVHVDREARQTLRRVQAHVVQAAEALGAQHDTLGMVETVCHPANALSTLNYVLPRQKTAWVPAAQVEQGLDYLTEQGRRPRVIYIEGLMPARFARTLVDLDLEVERETPIMIYQADETPTPPATLPYDVRMAVVDDVRTAEVWWYTWQNAYYDVFTLGVEPIFVARTHAAARLGNHLDIVFYRETFPFAAARLTLQGNTAHLVGVAVFREMRTPALTRWLHQQALHAALERGCDLVFAPGSDEIERENLRNLGFVDFGSLVCYAAKTEKRANGKTHDAKPLVQPILNLR